MFRTKPTTMTIETQDDRLIAAAENAMKRMMASGAEGGDFEPFSMGGLHWLVKAITIKRGDVYWRTPDEATIRLIEVIVSYSGSSWGDDHQFVADIKLSIPKLK